MQNTHQQPTAAHQSHLDSLISKHATLSQRIEREQSRPAAQDAKLKALKMEKLRLKEQITNLNINE